MKPFDYQPAQDIRSAVATVAARPEAQFLAGGTNLLDHMKLGVAEPELLVDVTALKLDGIEQTQDGTVRIGAGVRNSELAAHPMIRSRYPGLTRALLSGASGQLRNLATTGGNLLQRTRCPYFEDVSKPCNKRRPGSGCAAIGGYNRYHAILGASPECIAVHPSDMAVALAAFDAELVVQGVRGERRIAVNDLYRPPSEGPDRDTQLAHGELITAVELPPLPLAGHSTYRKVRDRASYAFALVSVAAALRVERGEIAEVRIALGGVAPKPWRARKAEQVLIGQPARDESYHRAADAELADARTSEGSEYKVPLVTNTLAAVLRELAQGQS
ncbi:xanthine dehydrogenase family protein subunit M [Saccharopolyspora sp. K220]|uniref:FAD binding domain-containing protein n=1 Tax=Saccharopolyspora soli TaxID=2926618 RepID=UPI001F5A6A20|nr:xanthine dehydrogenase family protein subunit M [Saccharopolyspora soli]MCI2423282.1 xanthine dehydrogenase family protein subunit M [Saccharopolyspora soli]